ncbi:MAG TPA: hypothetical protein VIW01_07975 [Dehalococcoidia bacterium]
MDSVTFAILGPALIAGGIAFYRWGTGATVRALGAAGTAAGSVMALIGWVNALSGTA